MGAGPEATTSKILPSPWIPRPVLELVTLGRDQWGQELELQGNLHLVLQTWNTALEKGTWDKNTP